MDYVKPVMLGIWLVLPKSQSDERELTETTPGVFMIETASREEAYQQAVLANLNWATEKLIVQRCLKSLFPLPSLESIYAQRGHSIDNREQVIVEVDKPKFKKTEVRICYKDHFSIEQSGYVINEFFVVTQHENRWQVLTLWTNDYVTSGSTRNEAGMIAQWLNQFLIDCEQSGHLFHLAVLLGLKRLVELHRGQYIMLKIRT